MRYLLITSISILFFSCTSKEDESQQLYTYLEECNQNYYENKGIDVNEELEVFYNLLLQENQIESISYASLNKLLNQLAEKTIFPALQNIEIPQDHQFLNSPPQELFLCVHDLYDVDSLQFSKTAYYQLENELLNYIQTTSEPSVNRIWSIYSQNLTPENYQISFYRKNILIQLFRWYYVCKYEGLSSSTTPSE